MVPCFHCGDDCGNSEVVHKQLSFCCHGCVTVFDILNDNDLSYYYDLDRAPGISPKKYQEKFDFLDNPDIVEKLLDFNDGGTQVVTLLIPSIHCSSCIWVLENLSKLNPGVVSSLVNFPEKKVQITFQNEQLSLKDLAVSLARIGYAPSISLEDYNKARKKVDRSLLYKIGIAGFAFGNVMFLSFPEYFEVNEFWLERFKWVFRWLMFGFSVPVVFYSGRDYFISAYRGLLSRALTIDMPIAIGIATLFIRSTIDITFDLGSGFFDSLTGLVFFLLLGKFFQQKTYSYLSFERDYKSYFPIAVTRLKYDHDGTVFSEEQVQVYDIKKGDHLLIRSEEIIPTDGVLRSEEALIDYSFVTGEAIAKKRCSGDKIYAGGRQKAGAIEIQVSRPIAHSYLTKLWSNDVFQSGNRSYFQSFTDTISKHFTLVILSLAISTMVVWLFLDPSKAFNVFTAVLIVACPCALALATPFTMGNILRILGGDKLYLKDSQVIERMGHVDAIVFDKTGTLTANLSSTISYHGLELSEEEQRLLSSTLRASNHPLSRTLYELLGEHDIRTLDNFKEHVGKGIVGVSREKTIKLGSSNFVGSIPGAANTKMEKSSHGTTVHISSNEQYKGFYQFKNKYRTGLSGLFNELGKTYDLSILSGDNDGERAFLEQLLPETTNYRFNQSPEQKLSYIKQLQQNGKKVMMVGDGLNDAGALAQSDVGIAVSENINVFSPASDGIMDAGVLSKLGQHLKLAQRGITIVQWSFGLSLLYNLVGLGFAVTGKLEPVIAAILMPLSSISIVLFTTLMSQWAGRKMLRKIN